MIFRVLFAFSLLTWALLLKQNSWMLGLVIACMLLMYLDGAKAILFIRSLKLLLWLFIPIIFFQGFFTPGTYIQTPVYLPLSIEGLNHAWFLCLHIMLMFFSALLFFRMLALSEWTYLLSFLPKLTAGLSPYLILVVSLRVRVTEILAKQHLAWGERGKIWLNMPNMMIQTIQMTLDAGHQEAHDLWQHWEKRMRNDGSKQQSFFALNAKDYMYGVLLLSGWLALWLR